MLSKLDIPLHGPSVSIVRKCGAALSDILESKFGCVATFEGVDFESEQSITQQKRPTVVPEKRCEFTLRGGVKVSVWKADLTDCAVDAVVNAANEQLQHCGGLALALSKAGGADIQRESDSYIRRHGDLKPGDAIVTDAGALPCKKIIHAVGPQLSRHASKSDVSRAEPNLKRAIHQILDRVKEYQLMTVAIPAISSGLFNYPLTECADVIVATVKKYYDYPSGLCPKEIRLVNNDDPTVKEMERACHQILGPHLQTTYSQVATRASKSDTKSSPISVQLGNVLLTLKKGRIEEEQADVIVNSVGTDRNLSYGQVSKAILQKAGHKMQDEIRIARSTGFVIATKPYQLRCKEVYHTCCTVKGSATSQQLFSSVLDCLNLANKNGHNSIAFPAIGTGALGFTQKEVAQIMSNAVNDFAKNWPRKIDVLFVIFPTDSLIFQAFEEQIRFFQQKTSHLSSSHAGPERRDDFHDRRALTPQIRLNGRSDEAVHEADRWLAGILSDSHGSFIVCNNFIQHFGEEELQQLSRLMKKGVSIEESFDRGRSSILVHGESIVDVAHVGLQVEAMLCKIQKDFVREEENAMMVMVSQDVTFERVGVRQFSPEFADRKSAFHQVPLRVVRVEKVENATLKMLFGLKTTPLQHPVTHTMFQCISAQFFDMISHVGFHAECAPPDDPAYGEGIYFTDSVKRAMEVWKEPNKEYLHFVEAEVLTGFSTQGREGLLLPPAMQSDPQRMYDSVTGPGISVIFSGYQALPKYIITCKVDRMMTQI